MGLRLRHRPAAASARRLRRAGLALAAAATAAGALPAFAGAAVALAQIGTFDQPVFVGAPAGDTSRVFVVERPGRVQLVRPGATALFLDLTDRVLAGADTERGLLSVAFAPDFATSGVFYAY